MKRRSFRTRLTERGQALVVMAVMIMTFVMFLMFVVGTGLLIHAKINLQNAADLAAYAGASAQARQLNSISYLNYEMRRQYKKFLFRYYVLGNMAMQGFPGNPRGGGGDMKLWSPDGTPANNYQLPVVCMIYDPTNNYCKLQTQKALSIPENPYNTPSQAVLIESLRQIERLRQAGCSGMSEMNKLSLQFWLFSTQPDLSGYISSLGALTPEQTRRFNIIKGVTKGVGLAIKEALLLKRIHTIEDYVNAPAKKALTLIQANQLKQSADPMLNERSVLAFMSAYKTLGSKIFANSDQIAMDELLPEGTATNLLRLKEIKTNFETYHVEFKAAPGTDGQDTRDCVGAPIQQRVTNIPLGVYKDPASLVYYAVRLRAKTRIPGIPIGEIELQAYSAAQPFGSRIGPALTQTDFTNTAQSPVSPGAALGSSSAADRIGLGGVPNLPVEDGDTPAAGWNRIAVLQAYYNVDPRLNRAGSMSSGDLDRIYHAAMSPNPYEIGKYNIPNDGFEDATGPDHESHLERGDRYVDFFNDRGTMKIYAPIVSKAKSGNALEQEMAGILADIGRASTTGGASGGVSAVASQAALDQYLANLRQGRGETLWNGDAEGFDIAVLADPFRIGDPLARLNLPNGILISNPEKAQTSWSEVHDDKLRSRGRTGYSVKYIALQHLFHPGSGMTSDGTLPWQNARGLASDPSLDNDVLAQPSSVKH